MDVLAEEIVAVTDNLKEACSELAIGMLETDSLLLLAGKLGAIEEELARVQQLLLHERQTVDSLKQTLQPIRGFFAGENRPLQSNSQPSALLKKSGINAPRPASAATSTDQPSPAISVLSADEFDALPKYLKGRLTVDKINNLVRDLNRFLVEKYTLLRGNPAKMPLDQRQRYYDWKQCENDETRGRHFLTETDLKAKSGTASFKFDQLSRSMLTILRQAGRIKEVRSTGVIRYVLNS